MRPKLSVIVPTFERQPSLQRCLASLARQSLPAADFEVIVVDDGSEASSFPDDLPISFPASFRFLREPHAGSAAARNAGCKQAEGEILLFFDDDVIASEGLLAAHVRAHKERGRAAVLGYTPLSKNLPDTPLVDYHRHRWDGIFREIEELSTKGSLPFRYFISLNLSVRRDDFEAIGPFDTGFNAAFEDTELGWRFARSGVSLRYCREALAWHRPTLTLESLTWRQQQAGLRAGRYYRAHPDTTAMDASLKVEYVLGYRNKARPLPGRIKERLRHMLLKDPLARVLLFIGTKMATHRTKRLTRYCLALVAGYHYSVGFRHALQESRSKQRLRAELTS